MDRYKIVCRSSRRFELQDTAKGRKVAMFETYEDASEFAMAMESFTPAALKEEALEKQRDSLLIACQ